MKKATEIYRDQDPYSRMVMQELFQLRNEKQSFQDMIKAQNQEIKSLEERYERMKGVLYFTFILSTLAIILILESLLYPILRTL